MGHYGHIQGGWRDDAVAATRFAVDGGKSDGILAAGEIGVVDAGNFHGAELAAGDFDQFAEDGEFELELDGVDDAFE